METVLWSGHMDLWYPASIATTGFYESISRDWQPQETGLRTAVYQARMTWTAAAAARRRPEFLASAEHGISLLEGWFVLEDGAVPWSRRVDGEILNPERHAYAASFVLFALAAVAQVRPESSAQSSAQSVFRYLEAHHRDRSHGGYWEITDDRGQPVTEGAGSDAIGTPRGQKSQNTHLHLLEAYTELYRAWPDPAVEAALRDLIRLFRDRLWVDEGWLHMFALGDWTPVPGSISHGHDIEAAHLLLAAASILPGGHPQAVEMAEQLAVYLLAHGIDSDGSVPNYGAPDHRITDPTKVWWVQAEAFWGLLAVYGSTGNRRYLDAGLRLWDWIQEHMIDPEFGGWWESLGVDGGPRNERKANAWKAAYHDGRALLYATQFLREKP